MTDNAPSILTPRWYPLKPHPEQMRLLNSEARFRVVPAGRRSGKTERSKRYLIRKALEPSKWDDPRFFAAAPTFAQAKNIYWSDLKAMIPRYLLAKPPNETELTINLINGAQITVIGMDRPERMEGRPWNGGILDEYANMKAQAWPENVRPALSDRDGWAWLIGVPEGRNHYWEWWKYAKSGVDSEWDGFTWFSSDILPKKEIESARRSLNLLTFQQEYEASWVSFEGRAYHDFEETTHCAPLTYRPGIPLILAFDWNVQPGVAAICQEINLPNGQFGTGVIGEVYIANNSTTPAVCRKIAQDWGKHEGYVFCYGDATGGARGSGRVMGSDWDLVRAELRPVFGDRLIFKVPKANPPERTRLNAVNSRIKNAAGEIKFMVDPVNAPNTVKDFEGVRLLLGGAGEIDKKADPSLSHISDGIGYYISKEFPISTNAAKLGNFKI